MTIRKSKGVALNKTGSSSSQIEATRDNTELLQEPLVNQEVALTHGDELTEDEVLSNSSLDLVEQRIDFGPARPFLYEELNKNTSVLQIASSTNPPALLSEFSPEFVVIKNSTQLVQEIALYYPYEAVEGTDKKAAVLDKKTLLVRRPGSDKVSVYPKLHWVARVKRIKDGVAYQVYVFECVRGSGSWSSDLTLSDFNKNGIPDLKDLRSGYAKATSAARSLFKQR